jgi:hypothetical protein
MSNVLIGIIGVILFIGLALAGALFLGPRFSQVTTSNTASQLMTGMKQVSDAADMRKIDLGKAYTPSTTPEFLMPLYLKAIPKSPAPLAKASPGDYRWAIQFNNNLYADGFAEPTRAASYVMAVLGPKSDDKARAICQEIVKLHGGSQIQDVTGEGFTPRPGPSTGCVITNGDSAIFAAAQYVAYIRLESTGLSDQTAVD